MEIVAQNVPWTTYRVQYASQFCEWLEGTVIKVADVNEDHDLITQYLIMLFGAYFAHRPLGQVRTAPFVMRLGDIARIPDIQIILNSNPYDLRTTHMDGPADICIEVVSPESVRTDYGEKFADYEQGGVREYWTIDPLRQSARFYHLDEETGLYVDYQLDMRNGYRTLKLPGLNINVNTLWQHPLPDFLTIAQSVDQMIAKDRRE